MEGDVGESFSLLRQGGSSCTRVRLRLEGEWLREPAEDVIALLIGDPVCGIPSDKGLAMAMAGSSLG